MTMYIMCTLYIIIYTYVSRTLPRNNKSRAYNNMRGAVPGTILRYLVTALLHASRYNIIFVARTSSLPSVVRPTTLNPSDGYKTRLCKQYQAVRATPRERGRCSIHIRFCSRFPHSFLSYIDSKRYHPTVTRVDVKSTRKRVRI